MIGTGGWATVHFCMKTIIDMANGAVTGLVLNGVPEDPPKLDSCPSCAPTKAQRLPFKTGCPRIRAAGTRPRRPSRPHACRINQSLQIQFHTSGRRLACELGTAPESRTRCTCGVRELGYRDAEWNREGD